MTDAIQIVAIVVSLLLLVLVLELVRRRQLSEEYSILWLVCGGALLLLSLWRGSLHAVARWLNVHYPPSLLLFVLGFFVVLVSLSFSVVLSRQRQQIERLAEEVALLETRLREQEEAGRTPVSSGTMEKK